MLERGQDPHIKNPWMSSLEEIYGTTGHRSRINIGVLELNGLYVNPAEQQPQEKSGKNYI